MPRLANPIELQLLKGADKKDPQRYKKTIPVHSGALGPPPRHLRPKARAMWKELETLALPGVITKAERLIFEMLANLFSEYREGPADFPSYKTGQIISCLGRLGMTPSDRVKLGTEKLKDQSDFNMF